MSRLGGQREAHQRALEALGHRRPGRARAAACAGTGARAAASIAAPKPAAMSVPTLRVRRFELDLAFEHLAARARRCRRRARRGTACRARRPPRWAWSPPAAGPGSTLVAKHLDRAAQHAAARRRTAPSRGRARRRIAPRWRQARGWRRSRPGSTAARARASRRPAASTAEPLAPVCSVWPSASCRAGLRRRHCRPAPRRPHWSRARAAARMRISRVGHRSTWPGRMRFGFGQPVQPRRSRARPAGR